jgi:biopolymer transport protein TolR
MTIATTRKTGPDINMTPLIDVLLVLLIIFMVITPLVPKGLPASIPQPASDEGDGRPIVIRMEANGALWINSESVTTETLGVRLAGIYQTRAERVVFVQGDSRLEFRDVARVIDIAKGAGADRIGLIRHAT